MYGYLRQLLPKSFNFLKRGMTSCIIPIFQTPLRFYTGHKLIPRRFALCLIPAISCFARSSSALLDVSGFRIRSAPPPT